MSNTAVGPIYKRVIDAVIEASRNDFEENGVSTAVLESMREKWQNRLSSGNRALFPWDPQPEPPSQAKSERTLERGPVSPPPYSSPRQINGNSSHDGMPIKQEPYDTQSSFLSLPPRPAGIGTTYASQRAAQLMAQQFGSQANGSITAMQAASQLNQRHQQQQSQNFSQYLQGSPYNPVSNGRPKQENSPQIKQESAGDRNGLGNSQTDGISDQATEWNTIFAARNSHSDRDPADRLTINHTIRQLIEHDAQQLEGGGLMVPFDERLGPRRRPPEKMTSCPRLAKPGSQASGPRNSPGPSPRNETLPFGGDMAEDDDNDEDEDEDAINSDLDDPDETADTTQEGVYEGDVILCLYDKVQRVKNKWKCVLRDGILTIDGKDYIFHKANGEFEW